MGFVEMVPTIRGGRLADPRILAVLPAILWATLAIAVALTRAPESNEAWVAIPALNLITHGSMGTTVLESQNTWLRGLDRHTYWQMPFDFLVQAAWYKMVGFGLIRQRLLSVMCAAILLGSWSRIVLRLTGMRYAAVFVWIMIGFEANFLVAAANGRMDILCAALGSAGIATWLELRAVPRGALLAAHALTAAAIFTHPCGVIFSAALVLISILVAGRISAKDLLLIALPYLAGAALWGLYIAQAPADFHSQFFGNSSGFAGEYMLRSRLGDLIAPQHALWDEVRLRYLGPFGFFALRTLHGALTAVWLLISLSASVIALCVARLRNHAGIKVLLIAELFVFLVMTFFEGMKFQHYLIYSLPFFAAITATVGAWLWDNYRATRAALLASLLLLTIPQIKSAMNIVRDDPLHNKFRPVTAYLHANLLKGEQVIGGAELGYDLGFDGVVRDDVRLGYYTGLRPRFIETSGWYRMWVDAAALRDPPVHTYIAHLLDHDYEQVLTRGEYVVYERKNVKSSK